MERIYVSDTQAVIEYFHAVFKDFKVKVKPSCTLSEPTRLLIDNILWNHETSPYRLVISCVSFIEIFEKWLLEESDCEQFYRQIYKLIDESPNIEVRNLDKEVLENFLEIGSGIVKEHDKLILATAKMLNATLISNDSEILKYLSKNKIVPKVIW